MSGTESDCERALRREERILVERVLAGEESAMEELADGYFPGLYRFALARLHGDSELARELVQATVCKVLAKLATYRGEAPLFTWLCACCRNEIRMHFRQDSRLAGADPLDDTAPPGAGSSPRPRRSSPSSSATAASVTGVVAPGVALDRAENTAMGLRITVPAGTFRDCVEVKETTPLEPGAQELQRYCPRVGLMMDGPLDLVSFTLRDVGEDDD